MAMAWQKRLTQVNRKWWWALGAFATYVAAGFLLAPGLIENVISAKVSEKLHLDAKVRELRVNPLDLSVDLKGFSLRDGQQTLVGLDELYINVDATSLFRWAIAFDQVRLEKPYVNAVLSPEGVLNLTKLIPPEDKEDKTEIRWLIHDFRLNGGAVDFTDEAKQPVLKSRLEPLNLALQEISSLPDKSGGYQLIAESGRGGRFAWKGELGLKPLRSRGHISIEGIDLPFLSQLAPTPLPVKLGSGTLAFATDYRLETGKGPLSLRLEQGSSTLRDLELSNPHDNSQLLKLPALTVNGITVKYPEQQASITEIRLNGGDVNVARLANGQLNWLKTLEEQTRVQKKPAQAAKPGEAAKPWAASLEQLVLEGFRIHVSDESVKPAFTTDITNLELRLKGLSQNLQQAIDLELDANIGEKGTLHVEGDATPGAPQFEGDLELKGLSLAAIQTYLKDAVRVELKKGLVDAEGHLTFSPARKPGVSFSGNAELRDFLVHDQQMDQRLLSFDSVALRQIDFRQQPDNLNIREVKAKGLFGRITINPDRSINLATLGKSPQGKAVSTTATANTSKPFPVKIGKVSFSDSALAFADMSMSPQFATGVEQLKGEITGLNSAQITRADLKLEGRVDRYGKAAFSGQINPLAKDLYADVAVNFKNVELTTLTPYSAKFAGYRIDKGKLNLDLHYLIVKRDLKAENKVVLDQLTLGDKVDSPDAMHLPLKLALALLKDSHGVIDIDLPISGSLDDPEFKYGPVIWKAFVNLLTKAVTAPFRMLASLAEGNEEEMKSVAFAVGTTILSDSETGKLEKISKALAERPALMLEVRGIADPRADGLAIRNTRFNAAMQQRGIASLTGKDQRRAFEAWLTEQLGKEAVPKLKALSMTPEPGKETRENPTLVLNDKAYDQRLRDTLIDQMPLGETEARSLALERAKLIKTTLVEKYGLDDGRIFVMDPDEGAASNGMIGTTLNVNAK